MATTGRWSLAASRAGSDGTSAETTGVPVQTVTKSMRFTGRMAGKVSPGSPIRVDAVSVVNGGYDRAFFGYIAAGVVESPVVLKATLGG